MAAVRSSRGSAGPSGMASQVVYLPPPPAAVYTDVRDPTLGRFVHSAVLSILGVFSSFPGLLIVTDAVAIFHLWGARINTATNCVFVEGIINVANEPPKGYPRGVTKTLLFVQSHLFAAAFRAVQLVGKRLGTPFTVPSVTIRAKEGSFEICVGAQVVCRVGTDEALYGTVGQLTVTSSSTLIESERGRREARVTHLSQASSLEVLRAKIVECTTSMVGGTSRFETRYRAAAAFLADEAFLWCMIYAGNIRSDKERNALYRTALPPASGAALAFAKQHRPGWLDEHAGVRPDLVDEGAPKNSAESKTQKGTGMDFVEDAMRALRTNVRELTVKNKMLLASVQQAKGDMESAEKLHSDDITTIQKLRDKITVLEKSQAAAREALEGKQAKRQGDVPRKARPRENDSKRVAQLQLKIESLTRSLKTVSRRKAALDRQCKGLERTNGDLKGEHADEMRVARANMERRLAKLKADHIGELKQAQDAYTENLLEKECLIVSLRRQLAEKAPPARPDSRERAASVPPATSPVKSTLTDEERAERKRQKRKRRREASKRKKQAERIKSEQADRKVEEGEDGGADATASVCVEVKADRDVNAMRQGALLKYYSVLHKALQARGVDMGRSRRCIVTSSDSTSNVEGLRALVLAMGIMIRRLARETPAHHTLKNELAALKSWMNDIDIHGLKTHSDGLFDVATKLRLLCLECRASMQTLRRTIPSRVKKFMGVLGATRNGIQAMASLPRMMFKAIYMFVGDAYGDICKGHALTLDSWIFTLFAEREITSIVTGGDTETAEFSLAAAEKFDDTTRNGDAQRKAYAWFATCVRTEVNKMLPKGAKHFDDDDSVFVNQLSVAAGVFAELPMFFSPDVLVMWSDDDLQNMGHSMDWIRSSRVMFTAWKTVFPEACNSDEHQNAVDVDEAAAGEEESKEIPSFADEGSTSMFGFIPVDEESTNARSPHSIGLSVFAWGLLLRLSTRMNSMSDLKVMQVAQEVAVEKARRVGFAAYSVVDIERARDEAKTVFARVLGCLRSQKTRFALPRKLHPSFDGNIFCVLSAMFLEPSARSWSPSASGMSAIIDAADTEDGNHAEAVRGLVAAEMQRLQQFCADSIFDDDDMDATLSRAEEKLAKSFSGVNSIYTYLSHAEGDSITSPLRVGMVGELDIEGMTTTAAERNALRRNIDHFMNMVHVPSMNVSNPSVQAFFCGPTASSTSSGFTPPTQK